MFWWLTCVPVLFFIFFYFFFLLLLLIFIFIVFIYLFFFFSVVLRFVRVFFYSNFLLLGLFINLIYAQSVSFTCFQSMSTFTPFVCSITPSTLLFFSYAVPQFTYSDTKGKMSCSQKQAVIVFCLRKAEKIALSSKTGGRYLLLM